VCLGNGALWRAFAGLRMERRLASAAPF